MKKQKDIEVELILTEGWQERFTSACYNLYLNVEKRIASSFDVLDQEAS